MQRQGAGLLGWGEEGDKVGIHLEAGVGARHVVRDDQVESLAGQFALRLGQRVAGFGGEGDGLFMAYLPMNFCCSCYFL